MEGFEKVSTGMDLEDSGDDNEVSGWGIDVVGGARGEEDVAEVRGFDDSEDGTGECEEVFGATGTEEVAELLMREDR